MQGGIILNAYRRESVPVRGDRGLGSPGSVPAPAQDPAGNSRVFCIIVPSMQFCTEALSNRITLLKEGDNSALKPWRQSRRI